MVEAKTKLLSIMLIVGICIFAYAFISASDEHSNHPNAQNEQPGTLERWQAQREDAERRIRKGWIFSDYAKSTMPAEMANGEWSSATNIFHCNTEQFDCAEVDFGIPDHYIKAAWLVSYEKDSLRYSGMRALSDSTGTLFQKQETDDTATHLPMSPSETTPVVPAEGEITRFIQRHYEMSSGLLALYANNQETPLKPWSEAPSSEYQQKDVCRSKEFDCFTVWYSDFKNKVWCNWIVAISRSDNNDQRMYPSDDARRWFNQNPSPPNAPLLLK